MKTILIKFGITQTGERPHVVYKTHVSSEPVIYVGVLNRGVFYKYNSVIQESYIPNGEDENFDITSISAYYRFPKINLSRDKMSLLKESKGIKKVLDRDKADLWVVSDKYMQSLINFNYRSSLSSVQLLRTTLAKENLKLVSNEIRLELLNMCKDLDSSQEVIILNDSRYPSYHSDSETKVNELIAMLCPNDSQGWNANVGFIQGSVPMKEWESITNSNKIIIEDKVMNNIASNDSITIDNETYGSIVKMIKGSQEDKSMAMSTMANCNINKSVGYLALLFFHFDNDMKTNPSYKHVAFKSLKDQFTKYAIEYSYNSEGRYSQFVEMLAKEGVLSVEILNHITHLMFERCLGHAFGDKGSSVFRLKSVDIDIVDKCKVKIKEPYTTLITSPTYALPF